MAHLKLGTYSFIIDADILGLSAGVPKNFTKENLPNNLKPLYDILIQKIACEKSVFVNFYSSDAIYSGFLIQDGDASLSLITGDGSILSLYITTDDVDYLTIQYNVI